MNRETAIKAIEAWRANPATTFTPANILREFGDDILKGLRASAPETRDLDTLGTFIEGLRQQSRRVRNFSCPDEVFEAIPLRILDGEAAIPAPPARSAATTVEPVRDRKDDWQRLDRAFWAAHDFISKQSSVDYDGDFPQPNAAFDLSNRLNEALPSLYAFKPRCSDCPARYANGGCSDCDEGQS